MHKYFLFVFIVLLLASCSTVEDVSDNEVVGLNKKYDEIFETYKIFKLDGNVVTDLNKVRKILANPMKVSHYKPGDKEIDFYTTESLFRKFNPENLESKPTDNNTNSSNGRYSADLGQFNTNYKNVTNLGDIFDQQWYRDFATVSYMMFYRSKYTNTTKVGCGYYKFVDDSNLLDNSEYFYINNSGNGVVVYSEPTSNLYYNANMGNYQLYIKNDSTLYRRYSFYSDTKYTGTATYIDLRKNTYFKIYTGMFDGFGTSKAPKSHTWVNIN